MSSLMHKPTLDGVATPLANGNSRRTANPAFHPEFRRSLMMHPLVAGVVALLVTLLALAYAARMKPYYQAESLIYIEPFSSKVLEDGSGNFDATKYDSSLQQQILTAQRVDILEGALETLPQSTWSDLGPTPQIAAQALQGQLKIARVTTSYQVSISLKGTNPANTAAVLNAVVAAYLRAGRKDALADSDQRSQLLTEERARIEQELAQTHQEQAQLGSSLGIANPTGEGTNPFDTQLDNLRSELTVARSSHDIAAAQLSALGTADGQRGNGLSVAANELLQADAGLSTMKSTINQRRAIITSQMAGLTPSNPVYKQDQDEMAELDKALDTMTVQLRDKAARAVQDKLRTDLQRTADIEGRINAQLSSQTARATTAAPRLQRAAELNADVQRLNARYAVVDNALRGIQLEQTGPGMAHLSLAAAVPQSPEPSRKRLVQLAALPIGILCGLFAAVFLRKRDPRLYSAGDVDTILGFGPIAVLPARGEVSAHVLDEYYLRLAAGVENAYRAGGARTFVLTPVSPSSDIGPLVQALDGKLEQLGLDTIVATAASVMEAPTAENAIKLHGTEGLAPAFFEEMKAHHTVILLNSPALLFSAQTEYIARCADVTILVAESGVTSRQELAQSGALLQRLNVTGVGAVLEEVQLRFADLAFARAVKELETRAPIAGFRRKNDVVPTQAAAAAPEEDTPAVAFVEPEHVPVTYAPVEPMDVPEPVARYFHEPEQKPEIVEEISTPVVVASEPEAEVALPEVRTQWVPVEAAVEPVTETPVVREEARRPVAAMFANQETAEESDVTPSRNWFQKMFLRQQEPVVSILPDRNEDEAEEVEEQPRVVATERNPFFDLPLPAAEEPVVEAPAYAEPVHAAPAHEMHEPVVAETFAPEVLHVAPVAEEPEPIAEATPFLTVAEPEPISAVHVMAAPQAEAAHDFEETPTQVLSPKGPARPLSFRELSQMSAPAEPLPPAAAPEPMAEALPAAAAIAETPVAPAMIDETHAPVVQAASVEAPPEVHAEPVAVVPEPVAVQPEPASPEVVTALPKAREPESVEEWVPAPLNRWEPIPPLRASQEPWRSRQFQAYDRSSSEPVEDARKSWPDEDPIRIAPTDHWGAPDSAPPVEPMAESSDIVLTRRWGLLSRFQQGENFARGQQHRDEAPVETGGPYGRRG